MISFKGSVHFSKKRFEDQVFNYLSSKAMSFAQAEAASGLSASVWFRASRDCGNMTLSTFLGLCDFMRVDPRMFLVHLKPSA